MYDRLLKHPFDGDRSFFLFGPRGTGKTAWLRRYFPDALYLDLLDGATYRELLARPERLAELIPKGFSDWILIDELQRVPELLNEVHRLIEHHGRRFVLTGSSARTLRRKGVNLLAGRALTYHMYPLTAMEQGGDFDLDHSLKFGHLPTALTFNDPASYLEAYVETYLREEVMQEGLVRDLSAFSRFLEVASFSQGSVLNASEIARESQLERRTVAGYFGLTEDLLLSHRLSVFARRAKRRLITHSKFYFFDAGVFRAIRPKGLFDRSEEIEGIALETLVLQELMAVNDYLRLGYSLHYWRTSAGVEVDFVLYGAHSLHAIEVKHKRQISPRDLRGLKAFGGDYPEAQLWLFYRGDREQLIDGIRILPVSHALANLQDLLA